MHEKPLYEIHLECPACNYHAVLNWRDSVTALEAAKLHNELEGSNHIVRTRYEPEELVN
jgi:hypothetical protein